ncbi:MAG: phosphoribosylglycinamide formyltransferase [Phycisphaerales bacterium]|nr:phosphoribosylglycinamide formyltransferase [Phycisphaerales bacterium]
MTAPRIAVLFSGGGRTVLNLLDHIEAGTLNATIDLAICSRSGTDGEPRIAAKGLGVQVVRGPGDTAEVGNRRTIELLRASRPDLICLCGYLRLLEMEEWMGGRVLNIHPSLLPKYGGRGMYGMRVHQAVLEAGDTESGCTVHVVDDHYDHGPTILQSTCAVLEGDTPQDLAARVFALECEAYPAAIAGVLEGSIMIDTVDRMP